MPAQNNQNISRFSSIRARLILSFVLIVFIPMAIVSTVLAITATQNVQAQLTTQLQTVANYKRTAINELLSGLQTQLETSILGEAIDQNINTLLQAPQDSIESQTASLYLQNHFKKFIEQSGEFQTFFVMNAEGQVLFSTDAAEGGKNYKNEVFFQGSLFGPFTYLSSFTQTIIVSLPIHDENNQTTGFVAGKASTAALNKIMQNTDGLGQTGKTYLVSLGRVLLTTLPDAQIGDSLISQGIVTALESQSSGSDSYEDFRGIAVFGVYTWIPAIRVILIAEQEQAEASEPIYFLLAINIGITLAAIFIAIIASLRVTRSIAAPIDNLAEVATRIADGQLDLEADAGRSDEIGMLAFAFNNMTNQLRQTLESLELRVRERTTDLEQRTKDLESRSGELAEANTQVRRRIIQLEAISRVAKSITSIQNLQELLPLITRVISEQFGFYHAGVFLTDATNEYAVLSAANSEGGQRMLSRNHRLKTGQNSIVGYVTATGKPHIVLDTEKDNLFSKNPDLPETRAEMALPLRIGDKIIGAIDVQSTDPGAFSEQDAEALSTLADQVSIAIRNSQLFESTQQSLAEINTIYRQSLKETWAKTVSEQGNSGYQFGVSGNQPLREELKTEGAKQAIAKGELVILQGNSEPELATPIKLRGQTIGVINVRAPEGHIWKQNEINVLQAIAERVAVSAENARLFEETTRRAERERAVSTITTKIRSTNDPEEMLAIAISEIKNALNAREIRIKEPETQTEPSTNS